MCFGFVESFLLFSKDRDSVAFDIDRSLAVAVPADSAHFRHFSISKGSVVCDLLTKHSAQTWCFLHRSGASASTLLQSSQICSIDPGTYFE